MNKESRGLFEISVLFAGIFLIMLSGFTLGNIITKGFKWIYLFFGFFYIILAYCVWLIGIKISEKIFRK